MLDILMKDGDLVITRGGDIVLADSVLYGIPSAVGKETVADKAADEV